jgi:hypothetical protein
MPAILRIAEKQPAQASTTAGRLVARLPARSLAADQFPELLQGFGVVPAQLRTALGTGTWTLRHQNSLQSEFATLAAPLRAGGFFALA